MHTHFQVWLKRQMKNQLMLVENAARTRWMSNYFVQSDIVIYTYFVCRWIVVENFEDESKPNVHLAGTDEFGIHIK